MGGGGNTSATSKTFNMASLGVDQTSITNIQALCNQQISEENILQIVGSTVKNFDSSQMNSAKNFCEMQAFLKSSQDASVKNDVLTALSSDLKANAGLLTTGSSSQSDQNVVNQTFAKLNQTEINNILQKCIQSQNVENIIQIIGSNASNVSSKQVNDSFLNCISGSSQDMSQSAKAESVADTTVQDKGESKSGVDIMASFASLSAYFTAIAVICGIIVFGSIISSSASLIPKGGSGGKIAPGGPVNVTLNQGATPDITPV